MGRTWHILHVEDSPSDVMITQEAFKMAKADIRIHVAPDGEAAAAFLRRQGTHAAAPRPDLILLDLNLPRKDGRELLAEVKRDRALLTIPVIVLTSSEADEDVRHCYEHHANSYLVKPTDFGRFQIMVRLIEEFWLEAAIPPG